MIKLAEPTRELASRVLQEVDFDHRIVGVKMTPMAGNLIRSIYSFKEAVDFLHVDKPEELLSRGGRPSVGYLELGLLSQWIGSVFKDEQLSKAIKEELGQRSPYRDQVASVRRLMTQRLEQCERLRSESDI